MNVALQITFDKNTTMEEIEDYKKKLEYSTKIINKKIVVVE